MFTFQTKQFDGRVSSKSSNLVPVAMDTEKQADYPQPSIFVGKLKTYQIKVSLPAYTVNSF